MLSCVAVTNASPTTVSLSLHQSVLIFQRFAAANAKVLPFLNLVHPTHGPPQLCRSTVAIDTLQYQGRN